MLSEVTWRPPVIETERLLLRGKELSDVAEMFGWASDPEVTPYMAWDPARSIDDTFEYLNGLTAENYRAQELDYGLALRTDPGTLIGGLGVYTHSPWQGVMELGYVLDKEHWGNGYVPEACRALIDFAFQRPDVQRVFAPIFSENAKSRRAAEKMGLRFEGVLRSSVEYRGVRRDQAFYALVRADLL